MANYYYKFDRTSSNFDFTATTTIPDGGYDLSQFNGDSRGAPRVADWSDFSSFNLSQFGQLVDSFGLTSNSSIGYFSWNADPYRSSGNKYYRNLSSNRAYYLAMSLGSNYIGGWHLTNNVSNALVKNFI